MRFLSLFSGIEAASQAWPDWTPVAFAEIEKFPCAVLQHHYPDIPNLGDVEKITQEQIEALGHIDVVIFGFPCTDLSVAGQRKGLKNADGTSTRSGLFYTAARIAEWSRARWTLAENVPGLFSSCEGRDFGAVVGELAGCQFGVPADGWRNSGFALGPKGLVEWTTLDAQWFHLAQRRERVFIIRDSGDWAGRPPLLLEPKSLRRHSQASRQPGKRIAPTIEARVGAGGAGWGTDFMSGGGLAADSEAIPILEPNKRQGLSADKRDGLGIGKEGDPSFTLQAGAQHGVAIPIGIAGSELGYALRASASHSGDKGDGGLNTTLVAFPSSLSNQSVSKEDLAPTLESKNPTAIAFTQNSRDEVRHNGGNIAGALAAEPGVKQQTYVAIPINMQAADGVNEDVAAPLTAGMAASAARMPHEQGCLVPEVSPTLRAGGNKTRGHRPPGTDVDTCETLIPETGGALPEIAWALQERDAKGPDSSTKEGHLIPTPQGGFFNGMAVRRLTPIECARLMGFSDNYLDIEFRGKPACDGVKYRALGNSMAVPVISYIGRQIELVANLQKDSAK